MRQKRLEIGSIHNNWVVLSFVKAMSQKDRHSGYMCKCICGTVRRVDSYNLINGTSKSCGCNTRLNLVNIGTKPIYESIYYTIYTNYQKQAQARNYSFELTLDEFKALIIQDCHYCGEVPTNSFKSGKRRYHGIDTFRYNGIDRKVNSLGYTIDNCVPCCPKCNFAKKNYDYDEWVAWIHKISNRIRLQESSTTSREA